MVWLQRNCRLWRRLLEDIVACSIKSCIKSWEENFFFFFFWRVLLLARLEDRNGEDTSTFLWLIKMRAFTHSCRRLAKYGICSSSHCLRSGIVVQISLNGVQMAFNYVILAIQTFFSAFRFAVFQMDHNVPSPKDKPLWRDWWHSISGQWQSLSLPVDSGSTVLNGYSVCFFFFCCCCYEWNCVKMWWDGAKQKAM